VDPNLEREIIQCRSLPSLPEAALEVLAACRAEEIDLQQIASILSRDPAMAARVLAAANVAAFGWGEVASLPRAVLLLGANRVLCVVLTFSLLSARRQGTANGFDYGAFWRRAIYAAIAARAIAEEYGLEGDEALLAGLLQDFGCLALAEALGARYGQIHRDARGNHWRLADLERDRLGATHVDVTCFLAQRWRLPARLREAARTSHLLPDAIPARLDLPGCVALSGPFGEVWAAPSPVEPVASALDSARAYGIGREAVAAVLARIGLLVPGVAAELQVTVAPEEERKRVLAEARTALDQAKNRLGGPVPWDLEPLVKPPPPSDGEL